MLGKVDLQLFRASLRAISADLQALNPGDPIPKRVFDELSCMQLVIERSLNNDPNLKWLSQAKLPRK